MAVDLEEEIKRQRVAAALSSLDLGFNDLTPASADDSDQQDASSKSDQLDVPKHVADHFGNPNDWPTVYDTTTQQAVGAPSPEPDIKPQQPTVFDTETKQSVGAPSPEPDIQPKWDTQSAEFVGADRKPDIKPMEPMAAESVVPYGERETPAAKPEYAPMDTGKGVVPGTYPTVAEDQGAELPADALPQVERATLVKLPDEGRGERGTPIPPDLSQTTGFAVADPNPINHDYRTPLSPDQEKQFQAWVKKNNVPFNDSDTSDYDMRGFWKAGQEGDPDASTAVSKFDGKIHFNDKFKTPFHKTFSNESQYATPDAPHWVDDKLIDNQGNVVADETPGTKGKQPPVHVEKALPAAEPAPGRLSQVERALPTGPKAPDAHTELAAPGQMDLREDTDVPTAKAVPATATQQPAAVVSAKVNPNDPNTWPNADGSPVEAPPQAAASTEAPMNAPNGKPPAALIIHHTSGNNSAESVVNDWRTNRPGVGAQMIMDRDGTIHNTQQEFGYGGTGNFLHSVVPGVSNQTAVGIEVIAKNDADMTPAQLKSLQKLAGPGGAYANVPVYGHSQVSPGDRENEGVRGVAAINEARKSGAASIDNHPNLNVTHYAYQGDPDLDPESRAGHGKYVKDMVAGYDVALNNAAATALGAKPGQEFEYGGRTWRYADQVPERYKDARIDIYDPNDHFGDFKPAGGVASAPAVKKNAWDDWLDVAPAAVATAQAQTGKEFDTLNAIRDRTPNVGALWKTLNSPIAGVSDNARTQYLTQAKKGITDYALDYYKESHPGITPDEAFKLATGDANFGTLAGEVSTKIIPNLQSAAISLNRAPQTVDENRINDFLNVVNPNLTPEQRIGFKRDTMSTLAAMNPTERAQYIGNLVATDPQKFAGFDVAALADSFDRISDPAYQARLKSDLAVAKNKHDLATDPRLVNTPAEGLTQFLASAPKNLAETFSGPIGQSAMLSEIYFNTADQLRHEHPDWSEDDVKQKASASTLAQLGPQELLMRVTGGLLGAATKGITNPLMEFGARYGLHGTVAAVAGGVQQMGKNLAEGRPMMDGVLEAAGSAAPYGLVGAAVGGRHYPEPGPEPTVMEPNLNTFKQHGPPEPTWRSTEVPEDTGKIHGPPLEGEQDVGTAHGPKTPPGRREVSPADVMGFQEPEAPAPQRPWYMQGAEPGQDPLVIRGAERSTFTPQELSEAINRLPADQLARIQDLRPAKLHLDSQEAQQAEIDRAQAQQAMLPGQQGQKQTLEVQQQLMLADQIKRMRIAKSLGIEQKPIVRRPTVEPEALGKPPASPAPRPATPIEKNPGHPEPWLSEIANRFVAERVAKGDIGPVEPGHGETTEALVARGARMNPEQIAQHVSNLRNNVGGDPTDQGAAVRYEEARLSQRAHQLSQVAEADPTNQQAKADADEAFHNVTDFHQNVVAKLKNDWHKRGMTLQGSVPVDLTSFNGQREEYLRNTGKPPMPDTEKVLRRNSQKVRDATAAEQASLQKLGTEVDRQTARRPMPTHEQVKEAIVKRMGGEFPCPT